MIKIDSIFKMNIDEWNKIKKINEENILVIKLSQKKLILMKYRKKTQKINILGSIS